MDRGARPRHTAGRRSHAASSSFREGSRGIKLGGPALPLGRGAPSVAQPKCNAAGDSLRSVIFASIHPPEHSSEWGSQKTTSKHVPPRPNRQSWAIFTGTIARSKSKYLSVRRAKLLAAFRAFNNVKIQSPYHFSSFSEQLPILRLLIA
jgi:hypothetical protein